jgi:DNA-binding LacI/PurR family transcriptional regulator
MAATIKDVAQRAGVSHPTVSRALRGDPSVRLETTRRIHQAAQELGYVPSAAARSLKTNRTRAIGVLVHRVSDPFYAEVLDGIQDTIQAARYSLLLASTNNDRTREEAILRAMTERRVDGLILCSMFITPERRRELDPRRTPLVLIHNRAAEMTPDTLYHDDRLGMRELTRYLITLGHTRLGFIGNARAGRVTEERLAGFYEETQAAGLEIPEEYVVSAVSGLAAAAVAPCRALLALREPPTAILCFDDLLAIGAIQALVQCNKRVPADCSITGFDNIPIAEVVNPPLTTFNQPKYTLGTRAANLLLNLIDANADGAREPEVLVLRGEILVRASTAPPPA